MKPAHPAYREPRGFGDRIDAWIFTSYDMTPQQLGLYRIAFASFALFVIGVPRFSWVAEMPQAFFHPPLGVARLFGGFPPLAVLELFGVGLVVLHLALLAGYRTRVVSIAVTLLAMCAYSFEYSFGKINHTRTFLSLLPLLMSFSNWGAAYSIDARRGRAGPVHTWPVALLAVLLGFAMFTAGYPKLTSGWLSLGSTAVREKVFYEHFVNGKSDYLIGWLVRIDGRWPWELVDWGAVLFELGFLAAVVRAGLFRFFTGVAVFFHTATLLMLNIGFLPHLIVYLIFSMPIVQVPRWLGRLPRVDGRLLLAGCAAYVGIYLSPVPATATAVGSAVLTRLGVPGHSVSLVILLAACALALWIASVARRARSAGGTPRRTRGGV